MDNWWADLTENIGAYEMLGLHEQPTIAVVIKWSKRWREVKGGFKISFNI